ncbi:MAG TPA: copper-containing nitrite reductase [Polyangiaceae bacterium]
MARSRFVFAIALLLLLPVSGCGSRHEARPITALPESIDPIQGQELAETASAPNVPPPIARTYSTRVILNIEVKEHTGSLADGVTYTYWTFGDETPGKFIRVREGDLVETHLSNHPDNTLAHNIDFHGATGPGGGGEASFVAPGHTTSFTWRAMRPGLFLYHCVAAPAGLHIANGMYGLILVEPKAGLPPADKEFYVAQGEFYTSGKFGAQGPQSFSLEKALHENPEYVVFNGHVGALMGDNALKAKVGESVRIYLGNAGPSLVSSFHIVGEIFDNVYGEGGILPNQHNVQTTAIPVGGSAMVEFTASIPGQYTLVDHSMFRAFNKGAMGELRISGKNNDMIFTGRTSEEAFQPGTHLQQLLAKTAPLAEGTVLSKDELMDRGQHVFSTVCFACHQSNGQGLPNTFPPLAGSDFLMADKDRSIRIVLQGLKGDVIVNGAKFHGEMPKPPLSDDQVAGVLSYVRNSFGNSGEVVTLAEVERVRRELEGGPSTLQAISRTEEE